MRRFLLIGLDGAEPSLVECWMREGFMPHLERLRRRGSYLPLQSTMPPATFPAWTTCVTGVNPGRHGIFDFTEINPGTYSLRFLNANDRKAPALWNILSAAGKRVAVIGVPATYPPDPVNGIMLSGFDSPVCTAPDRSFVYPPALYEDVRQWRFADFQETDIGPGWHDRAFQKLLQGIKTKEAIAVKLLKREPWDFFMVVFGESDTVAHHFWLFCDAQSPRHRPGHEHAIRDVYKRLDAAVGNLVDAAGDAIVAVVSDHGFGGTGTGVVHLNNWLAEQGHLRFAPSGAGLLKNLALGFVPASWRGAAFRRFQRLAARAESRSRFAGIDWRHTRAWSEELNYFPSVRVNLKGREPCGQVDPAEYDTFCRDLCAELESWPPVKKAWRRDDLYKGDHVGSAPDIVLDLALENGYSYSCLRSGRAGTRCCHSGSRGSPALRRIAPDEYLGGKERGMNGNHRPVGILFVSMPVAAGMAHIQDVAPTVLAALGVPAPPMDGASLLGPAAPGAPSEIRNLRGPYDAQKERIVEDRLRALGYLE
jgi:predicted AlkP superfamily phosphohydrolase/phosphomutase